MEMSSEFQVANLNVSSKINTSLGRCSVERELPMGQTDDVGAKTAKYRAPGSCWGGAWPLFGACQDRYATCLRPGHPLK